MRKLFALLLGLQLILAPVAFGAGEEFRKGGGDNSGAAFYANQIVNLSTATIGASALTMCKYSETQISMWMFFLAGVLHMTSEFAAGKDVAHAQSRTKESMKMLEDKMKGGEVQKAALEAALEDEKRVKDYIHKKKIWTYIVMGLYYGSMAMAAVEGIMKLPPMSKDDGAGCQQSSEPEWWAQGLGMAWGIASGVANKDSGGGTFGMIAGFIPMLMGMSKTLSKAVGITYNTSYARAITFGVSAALTTMIVAELEKKEDIVEKNIHKLEAIIAGMKGNDNGAESDTGTGGALASGPDASGGKPGAIARLSGATASADRGPCVGKSSSGIIYSESACGKPLQVSSPRFGNGFNSPALSAFANDASALTNQLASGNIGAANLGAASLAANAARMKKLAEEAKGKLNEKLIAQGQKPIDFDAEIQKGVNGLLSTYNQSAGANQVASLGQIPSAAKLGEDRPLTKPGNSPTGALGTASAPAAANVNDGVINLGEDLPATEVKTASLSESLEQFETNENDISKSSDVSIFKQLSNRYILNLNKIFNKNPPPKKP